VLYQTSLNKIQIHVNYMLFVTHTTSVFTHMRNVGNKHRANCFDKCYNVVIVNDICSWVYSTVLCQKIHSCLLNGMITTSFSTFLRRKFLKYRLLSSVTRLQLMCHLSLCILDLLFNVTLIVSHRRIYEYKTH
jgi:hypothetical protein